jgi:hypothetical protein
MELKQAVQEYARVSCDVRLLQGDTAQTLAHWRMCSFLVLPAPSALTQPIAKECPFRSLPAATSAL